MNNYTEEAHNTLVMLTKCLMSSAIVILSFFIFHNVAIRVTIFFIAPIIIFMIPGRYNRL
jgi:nucleoside recognition membrane protein YjiH